MIGPLKFTFHVFLQEVLMSLLKSYTRYKNDFLRFSTFLTLLQKSSEMWHLKYLGKERRGTSTQSSLMKIQEELNIQVL